MAQSKNIDWEQRRYEIARDLFVRTHKEQDSATYAVMYADWLISELKKSVIADATNNGQTA